LGGIGNGSEKRLYEGLAETADRTERPKAAMRKGDAIVAASVWACRKNERLTEGVGQECTTWLGIYKPA